MYGLRCSGDSFKFGVDDLGVFSSCSATTDSIPVAGREMLCNPVRDGGCRFLLGGGGKPVGCSTSVKLHAVEIIGVVVVLELLSFSSCSNSLSRSGEITSERSFCTLLAISPVVAPLFCVSVTASEFMYSRPVH